MKNYLRYAFIAVLAFICNVSFAQEVTLDFTNNTTWKFPAGYENGATKAAKFSNGTYTITVEAQQLITGYLLTVLFYMAKRCNYYPAKIQF